MIPKIIKIHSKSIPNQPKGCPGALRKRAFMKRFGSFLDATTMGRPSNSIFQLLAPSGRFWAPFWCPAGRPGAPKIKFFGIKLHQNFKK